MRIVRLYSGDDGESYFEDLDVPIEGGLSLAFPVDTLDFRERPRSTSRAGTTPPGGSS